MIPANLIINADDFGINRRVSMGIAHCLEKGLIQSFSVLPFSDAFHVDLLQSLIQRFPQVRIGCHLALFNSRLQESPHYYRDFLKLYITGQIPAEAIYQQWKDQILSLGRYLGGTDRISHLDSHQHIHLLPGIWGITLSLQKEFHIPRLRVPYESLRKSIGIKFPFGLALQVLAWARMNLGSEIALRGDRRRLLGFRTSTRFTLEENMEGIRQVIAQPEQFFELMVHPALPKEGEHDTNPTSLNLEQTIADSDPIADSQVLEVEELEKLRTYFLSQVNLR